jgi:sulfoxide reductase heme-binding subunit YedZ
MSSGRGKWLVWSVLALPGLAAILRFALTPKALWGDLLHPTGEWSARFIILALAITPLRQLFPGSRIVHFLCKYRRAIGVAGFLYALLHLLFYVLDMETVRAMVDELGAPAIWIGWLALLLLLPVGLASNDTGVRLLKAGWKRVQRLAYPAAILTLVHWALVHDGLVAALVHFIPLTLLQGWRIFRTINQPFPRRLA